MPEDFHDAVVFLDDDGEPAGPDEVLDDGPERPPRRWPVALLAVAVAVAVVVAVLSGSGGDDPAPDTSAVVIPTFSTLAPASSSAYAGPCSEGGCVTHLLAAAETTSIRDALRETVGVPRALDVLDFHKDSLGDSDLATRVITAQLPNGTIGVTLSHSNGDYPSLNTSARTLAFQDGFVEGYFVKIQYALRRPSRDGELLTRRLQILAGDRRLLR